MLLPFLSSILFLSSLCPSSLHGSDFWHTHYPAAHQLANEKNLPLLIFFTGSDWCLWCQKLEMELFSHPAIITQAGSLFIPLKIDFPRRKRLPFSTQNQNRRLAHQWEVNQFPTILILNPNNEKTLLRLRYHYFDPSLFLQDLDRLRLQIPSN